MRFITLSCLLLLSHQALAAEYIIDQQDKQFLSDGQPISSLSINAGDSLVFRNLDPYFHNIFSLSELSTFDLGSFPEGEARSVNFDTAGEVEIECAIHPDMYMLVEIK